MQTDSPAEYTFTASKLQAQQIRPRPSYRFGDCYWFAEVQFSRRTDWHRQPNRLSASLETLRHSGRPIYDLTSANPTECGIAYPEGAILSSLSNPPSLTYRPNPRGLLDAREAISRYYQEKGTG